MPRDDPDREYLLVNHQEHTSNGFAVRWLINNQTLDMSGLMHLTRPLLGEETNNSSRAFIYQVKKNELIDLILQNTVALNGVCDTHPFHFHGHKFWVHSQGTGLYRPSTPIDQPVLRDTSNLYASSFAYFSANRSTSNHRQPCGWTKLRFRANNPGIWMLHCHIGAHAVMGMNLLLNVF
jgi:FtsP/CotA-like multicopper oxidase with cupredoxin domain